VPNHVTNELTAPKHVIDSISGGPGDDGNEVLVDFNTVIPMPEAMRDTESATPMIEDWAKIALGITTIKDLQASTPDPVAAFEKGDFGNATKRIHQANVIRLLTEGPFPKDFDEKEFARFINYIQCLKQHGHANWYEWSIANWGTKWNAYDQKRISDKVVRFDTAWSVPAPVIEALSKKFAGELIRIRWADEDFGNNAGDVTFRDGEIESGDRFQNDSKESHALALELKYDGVLPEDYKWVDGKRVYIEEEAEEKS